MKILQLLNPLICIGVHSAHTLKSQNHQKQQIRADTLKKDMYTATCRTSTGQQNAPFETKTLFPLIFLFRQFYD